MELDIKEIPFSRFGSYFCISKEKDNENLYIRDVHGGDDAPSKLFKLAVFKNGQSQDYDIKATETVLQFFLKDEKEPCVEMVITEEDELHILVQTVELKLEAKKDKYDTFIELHNDLFEYHIYPKELKLMVVNVSGEIAVDAPWNVVGNDYVDIRMSNGHFIIASYRTVYHEKEYMPFHEGKEKARRLYEEWFSQMAPSAEKYKASTEKAAYITWSSVVHPHGLLNYYSMYMSKLWMYNIWSWDNCFNALNLAKHYPELAFHQLKTFIDNQDESGAYPDFINDKFVSYNCIKPPIFAYIYEKMMDRNVYFQDKEKLRLVYESTKKVIAYFMAHRTYKGRLPHYKHGNDSGWDNASLFHQGMVVEAPDLTCHLIKSLDTMVHFANRLGEDEEAGEFKQQANDLFQLLMERLYDGEGFFGRVGKDAAIIDYRSSLLLKLPVIIGYRLDEAVLKKLVNDLEENFETTYGLATESFHSGLYKENGYWLGPIWAPVTYLLVDSLKKYGYPEMGNRIRDKFLDLTVVGGMAENFDPFTGKGLVDTSFTWTSSVFLLLLADKVEDA